MLRVQLHELWFSVKTLNPVREKLVTNGLEEV